MSQIIGVKQKWEDVITGCISGNSRKISRGIANVQTMERVILMHALCTILGRELLVSILLVKQENELIIKLILALWCEMF